MIQEEQNEENSQDQISENKRQSSEPKKKNLDESEKNKNLQKQLNKYRSMSKSCKCHLCGKVYKDHFILKSHLKNIHKVQPYSCKNCKETFEKVRDLKLHIKKEHLGMEEQDVQSSYMIKKQNQGQLSFYTKQLQQEALQFLDKKDDQNVFHSEYLTNNQQLITQNLRNRQQTKFDMFFEECDSSKSSIIGKSTSSEFQIEEIVNKNKKKKRKRRAKCQSQNPTNNSNVNNNFSFIQQNTGRKLKEEKTEILTQIEIKQCNREEGFNMGVFESNMTKQQSNKFSFNKNEQLSIQSNSTTSTLNNQQSSNNKQKKQSYQELEQKSSNNINNSNSNNNISNENGKSSEITAKEEQSKIQKEVSYFEKLNLQQYNLFLQKQYQQTRKRKGQIKSNKMLIETHKKKQKQDFEHYQQNVYRFNE